MGKFLAKKPPSRISSCVRVRSAWPSRLSSKKRLHRGAHPPGGSLGSRSAPAWPKVRCIWGGGLSRPKTKSTRELRTTDFRKHPPGGHRAKSWRQQMGDGGTLPRPGGGVLFLRDTGGEGGCVSKATPPYAFGTGPARRAWKRARGTARQGARQQFVGWFVGCRGSRPEDGGFPGKMAPAVGFEPTTNGLTVRCATAAPRRISQWPGYSKHPGRGKPASRRLSRKRGRERPRPESNRHIRICSPLHHHSATRPSVVPRTCGKPHVEAAPLSGSARFRSSAVKHPARMLRRGSAAWPAAGRPV